MNQVAFEQCLGTFLMIHLVKVFDLVWAPYICLVLTLDIFQAWCQDIWQVCHQNFSQVFCQYIFQAWCLDICQICGQIFPLNFFWMVEKYFSKIIVLMLVVSIRLFWFYFVSFLYNGACFLWLIFNRKLSQYQCAQSFWAKI